MLIAWDRASDCMRWATVGSVLLLLSGCLGQAPAPGAGEADVGRLARDPGSDSGPRTFDSSFGLVLNPDSEFLLLTMVAGNRNCVLLHDQKGPDYRILDGAATLSWDAQAPLAEELVLSIAGADRPVETSGPSPLVLDLAGLALHPEGGGLTFMADHEAPWVPLQQPAKLQLSFTYEGELPPASPGFCTDGL